MNVTLLTFGVGLALVALLFVFLPFLEGRQNKSGWKVGLGMGAFFALISIACLFGSGVFDSPVPPTAPVKSQTDGKTPASSSVKPLPPIDVGRLASACEEAKSKVNALLNASQMSQDISFTHDYWPQDQKANVRITVKLLTGDARNSYADGSMRKEVYSSIKAVYIDTLKKWGFENALVLIDTDLKF